MHVEHMKCPIDGSDLVITERQGVEIDYCPRCRGVWLDRGELDKIIERAAALEAPRAAPPQQVAPAPAPSHPYPSARQPEYRRPERDRDDDDRYRNRESDEYYYKKRKKKSFLDDLFDFD